MGIKVLNASQIRKADNYTIEHEKISSVELMERAAAAFVRTYVQMYDEKQPVLVFCGTGNNGGDGLAIARMLLSQQFKVQVYVVRREGKASADFQENLEKLNKYHEPVEIQGEDDFPEIPKESVVIDALFGTGISRPLEGLYASVIDKINESGAEVVAVDIPSGMYPDVPAGENDTIVRADTVITFHNPKLSFLMPSGGRWIRTWKIVNIGLHQGFLDGLATPYCFSDPNSIRKIYKSRSKWSHKGDFGKVLLIAGSRGKMGAGVLCARACLRSGAGLLSVYLPACGYDIMQISLPEAMVMTDPSAEHFSEAPDPEGFDVIGMGPGLGTSEETMKAFRDLLMKSSQPMVLDADALNLLSKHNEILEYLPENAVLTPHPKEFRRLTGEWRNDFERLQKQLDFSKKYKVVVVLKGAHTSISSPDGQVYFNSTGNPGMASGGTGDVLTGILAGLLGQKYSPFEAAILGVFLHGLAADLAAKELGEEALIASDLIRYLPNAFLKIMDPAFTIAAQVY